MCSERLFFAADPQSHIVNRLYCVSLNEEWFFPFAVKRFTVEAYFAWRSVFCQPLTHNCTCDTMIYDLLGSVFKRIFVITIDMLHIHRGVYASKRYYVINEVQLKLT